MMRLRSALDEIDEVICRAPASAPPPVGSSIH
jgi:hypothetical protein